MINRSDRLIIKAICLEKVAFWLLGCFLAMGMV